MRRCTSLLYLVGVVATCCSQAAPITVGMVRTTDLTVQESVGGAEVCAEVKMPPSTTTFSHSFTIAYEDRNSREGADYIASPVTFMLTDRNRTFCFLVPIVNDFVYELIENFFVNLTTTDNDVTLSPQTLSVTILDDEGKQMNQHKYNVTAIIRA